MEMTSSNSSVSFAVQLLSGSVGETLIFASHVIKSNAMEIMYRNIPKNNFQNVKA
jgi:hypothetical protein